VGKHGKVGQATDDYIIGYICFVTWKAKDTDRHSEYTIHIAFPRQQWLPERA